MTIRETESLPDTEEQSASSTSDATSIYTVDNTLSPEHLDQLPDGTRIIKPSAESIEKMDALDTKQIQLQKQRDMGMPVHPDEVVHRLEGELLDTFVYAFSQGSGMTMGLTVKAISAAWNHLGMMDVELVSAEKTDKVWQVVVKATNLRNMTSRLAAREEPLMKFGKPDPFAFTTAVSKAQRKAQAELLPPEVEAKLKILYQTRKGEEEMVTLKTTVEMRLEMMKIPAIQLEKYVQRRYNCTLDALDLNGWRSVSEFLNEAKGEAMLHEGLDLIDEIEAKAAERDIPMQQFVSWVSKKRHTPITQTYITDASVEFLQKILDWMDTHKHPDTNATSTTSKGETS